MSENNNKQKRKRVCPHCGRKLWMREFYPLKNGPEFPGVMNVCWNTSRAVP